jgi:hypothetical protein
MKRLIVTVAIAVLALVSVGQADYLYSLDNGTMSLAFYEGAGSGVWELNCLNQFTAQTGAETIKTISIVLGFTGFGPTNGAPFTLVLWNDPDQNGNPSDATVLYSQAAAFQGVGTGNYVDYSITPTTVSGSFFAGYFFSTPTPSNIVVFSVATNTPPTANGNRSWFNEIAGLGNNSPNNMAGMMSFNPNVGLPVDLMVRAIGIPEPATMLLLVGAGAAFYWRQRRRNR